MSYPMDNNDAAAFIIDGEKASNRGISLEIRRLLGAVKSIDADVFTYCGKTLVLARVTPPRLHRMENPPIRLRRQ